jgi:plastocyanin
MITNKKTKLLVPLFLTMILAVEVFLLLTQKKHVIILTDYGFKLSELQISVGDTVLFKTNKNESFWPASNLHPTHTIYSEFDPKRPLKPNEIWKFTFPHAGQWEYHDHIEPAFKGVITVGNVVRKEAITEVNQCIIEEERVNVLDCLQRGILKITEDQGVTEAVGAVAGFLDLYPEYNSQCHDLAHVIGEGAFKRYQEGKDVPIVGNMSMCGFGFYHGFMGNLLTHTGQASEAKKFCEHVLDSNDVVNKEQSYSSCFHGIGHGVFEGHIPSDFVSSKEVIASGLAFCDELSDKDHYRYMCATGIFNGLHFSFTDPVYSFKPEEREDPLSLCRSIKNLDYRKACYGDISIIAYQSYGYDITKDLGGAINEVFTKEAPYIDDVTKDEVVAYVASGLGRILLDRGKQLVDVIPLCRQLAVAHQEKCLVGFIDGLQQVAVPGKEHEYGFDFCFSDLLDSNEKKICISKVSGYLQASVNQQQLSNICLELDRKYKTPVCAN